MKYIGRNRISAVVKRREDLANADDKIDSTLVASQFRAAGNAL